VPGGEQTQERIAKLEERLAGFRELILEKFGTLEAELKKNSSDTSATKKLMVSILVAVVLGFVSLQVKGCL